MRYVAATILLLVVCAAVPTGALASDITVSAEIQPAVVQVGSEAMLVVTVEGKFRQSAEPELPPLDDFDVYNTGTSQNFSLINGRMQSSVSFRYSIVPKKAGLYKIEPVRLTVGDQVYKTKVLTLEVVAASNAVTPPPRTRSSGRNRQPAATGEAGKDDSIFIQASINRDTVYVNQQITWTLGYYSDGRITLMRSPNYTPPDAEGFWVEDLPPQNKYYASLNDRQYLVNEIKRGYFPTSPGLFEIGQARVDIVVSDMKRDLFDSFFDRSFFNRGVGREQTIATEKKEVVVLPLPLRGKPGNFGGVVAEKLKVSMSVDKQVVQEGEPVNVSVEINGRGNMKTIAPPVLDVGEYFKVYESGSQSDVFKKDYVVSGRKRYDFVMIPKVRGKHTIPAVEVPYFDPVREEYLVAQSHPVHLDVNPGTKEEGSRVIYAGTGDDFEVISKDIRFIHPVPATVVLSRGTLPGGSVFLALHALPILAVLCSLVVDRRRRRFGDNVSLARSSRALRNAQKKIGEAKKLFANDRGEEGYAAVSDAMYGYFADKTNTAAAGLTSGTIDEFLKKLGDGDETSALVRRVFDICNTARFAAAGTSAGDGLDAAKMANDALRAIEKRHVN